MGNMPLELLEQMRRALADGDYPSLLAASNELLRTLPIAPTLSLPLLLYAMLDQAEERERSEWARVSAQSGPVGLFLHLHEMVNPNGHNHRSYVEWRYRRIMKVLTECGTDGWSGRRVVELGGGLGDIGGFFADLGGQVLSLESRAENVCIANLRYRNLPGFQSRDCDLEQVGANELGRFDLAINFGFLEVVTDQHTVLENTSALADDIFLETVVADSFEAITVPFDYAPLAEGSNEDLNDRPFGRMTAEIPSPAYVEAFFVERGFAVKRLFDRDLNTADHIYDWTAKGDGTVSMFPCRRRFWRFTR